MKEKDNYENDVCTRLFFIYSIDEIRAMTIDDTREAKERLCLISLFTTDVLKMCVCTIGIPFLNKH